MKAYISKLISQAITQLRPDEASEVLGSTVFNVSYPKPELGDYASNAVMVSFGKFKKHPADRKKISGTG